MFVGYKQRTYNLTSPIPQVAMQIYFRFLQFNLRYSYSCLPEDVGSMVDACSRQMPNSTKKIRNVALNDAYIASKKECFKMRKPIETMPTQ